MHPFKMVALLVCLSGFGYAGAALSGGIADPQGKAVVGANVQLLRPSGTPVGRKSWTLAPTTALPCGSAMPPESAAPAYPKPDKQTNSATILKGCIKR